MGYLNSNNSNTDTIDSFDIPDGEYFVGIDYANVKYSDNGGGEYDSYYFIADVIILGSPNENENHPEIEGLDKLVGTKEQLFITVITKTGKLNKRGFEAGVNMISCFGLNQDDFNINNPPKIKASFENMPINELLGIPLSYAVLKVTRNTSKDGKVWVNKDIYRECTDQEVDTLNSIAPGFVDVKEVFDKDETGDTIEDTSFGADVSEEEIPF